MSLNQARTTPEPRFARTAAVIADPSRARMLALLLGGEARSAGELARAVSIAPQTASTHLAQLLDAGLVSLRTQGRHRYFMLADADVAHMLEAMSFVTERDEVQTRWDTPGYKPLKYARSCYCHLAGKLGVAQRDALLGLRVLIARSDESLTLSDEATAWFRDAQFDEGTIASLTRDSSKKHFADSRMDWSERREHLAGTLVTTLPGHYIERDWLRKSARSRALTVTPNGRRELSKLLGSLNKLRT